MENVPRLDAVQRILTDPKIAQHLETHQGAADAITGAAKALEREPDAIAAVRKLLPALDEKVVRVFFSYKKKDELAAKEIVRLLRKHSAMRLRIKYQADFTREISGRRWRDEIHSSIAEADWFVLLLPDPADDWDWCLFETGLFEAQRTSADRLICLYHPDMRVPNQIEDYHAVRAAIPDVEEFLKMVFMADNPVPGMPAINPDLTDEIPILAKQIVDQIRPPRKSLSRETFEPWVELKLDSNELNTRDDLDRAIIVDANEEALSLFEYRDAPSTWGELLSGLPDEQKDDRWRDEFFDVVQRIKKGKTFQPVQAVFQTKAGKMYRPVASAIDRLGDAKGPIQAYHVKFTEEIGALDHSMMPPNLAALATVLRFAFRFRWEVLERFAGTPMTDADVECLDSAFQRLQIEWQSRGGGDQATLEALFPEGTARNRVRKIFKDWAALRNPDGTGELDVAMEKKDLKGIQECLNRIIPLNQAFLEMATDVFSKLIHQ
jgi:hypothetical protein